MTAFASASRIARSNLNSLLCAVSGIMIFGRARTPARAHAHAASTIARTCMRTSAGRWMPRRTPRRPSIGLASRMPSTADKSRFFCASVPASPSGSAPAASSAPAMRVRVSISVTSRRRSS